MAKIIYKRLGPQVAFDDATTFYNLLSGGYGSGKTHALVMRNFKLMHYNFGLPGGLLAPSYKEFYRDYHPCLEEICLNNKVNFKFNAQKMFYYFPQTKSKIWIFHDEDKGKSIRGPNLAFMGINEIGLISEQGFKAAIARVRLKKAKMRQVAASGTPEGFNWVYGFFIENPRADATVTYSHSRENTHVADDYVAMLESSYDDTMAKMYVGGQYVNLNGLQALHKFNRLVHSANNVDPDQDGEIIGHIDFNVSPMCGTFYTWNRNKHELRGFLEVHLKNDAETSRWAQVAKEKLATVGIKDLSKVELHPDPAGNNRGTRASSTDIDILKQCGFTNLQYKARIMSVRDCLNAANRFIQKEKVIMDREKCKNTIRDWERTSLKTNSFELDKSDIELTHYVDGFKNMVEFKWPIQHAAGSWKSQKIR